MKEIKEKIESSQNIIIAGHVNPDGDTIGAGLALYLGLTKKYNNKHIDFVLQDDVPKNISFLSGTENIKKVEDAKGTKYDLVIFVDSANMERVGKVQELIGDAFKINIDHHISNPNYGDINLVKNISSTSEIMYSLLKELDLEISLEMGEAIYLGLVNDTGNFAHSNVTADTFLIASNLMKLGVNNNKIVINFFKTKSLAKMRILGKALNEMTFVEDKKLMYYCLPFEVLTNLNATKDDTEGLVEELLNYSESEVSLFLREEEDGRVKGSMRSKHDVDVNRIAGLFNGGGHIKAAGFTTNLSENEIIKKVVENL